MNILKKKCPKCGKEITSLYENQLEFNYRSHLLTHEEGKIAEKTKKPYEDDL